MTRRWSVRVCAAALAAILALSPQQRAGAREPDSDDPVSQALDEARRALVMGQTADAVAMYERLYQERPNDLRVFWALVRAYAEAGLERKRLVPLLERRVESDPDDARAVTTLAQAHAALGDRDRAADLWWSLLRRGEPDPGDFAEVGALMASYRMERQAADVYTEARRRFDGPRLFAQDLVSVYTALGEYENAFEECVNTVRDHSGRVSWATNRVEFMLDAGAEEGLLERKASALAADPGAGAPELGLAGGVLLVLGRFDSALAAYARVDELSGGDGQALIEFAVLLEEEGRLEDALSAYVKIVETHPGTAAADMAGKNGALVRAELGDPEGAVAGLKATAAAAVESNTGVAALYEAARIELGELARPRDALDTVADLKATFRRRPRRIDLKASLLEVDALVALGDLAEAEKRADSLVERQAPDEMGERALFLAGYIPFLRKDHERSVERFRTMVLADRAGRLVNDALRLMLVASDAVEPGGLAAFELFSEAHLAWRARKVDAARQRLIEIADDHPGTAAATESLMLLGSILHDAGDAEGALAAYGRVVEESGALGAMAEARMRRAGILGTELGDRDAALVEYRAILQDLPSNHLSGEARRRIEALNERGDAG